MVPRMDRGYLKLCKKLLWRVEKIWVYEILMFSIVVCANIGEERGIGVIVNFSAALIICEIDDLIMSTGRIQRYREFYENEDDESKIVEIDKIENCDFYKLGDRKWAHCGFMKVCIPKKDSVGDNCCMTHMPLLAPFVLLL